ncbi:MAG: hypothetical protein LBD24_09495 [Spirochaetaceae bacterium]|jgi:hypothetical protein|nr:hypothetical protein [Spirochaetaceae bacterium]
MSVEQIIKDGAKALGSRVYIAPVIEEKKLNNAVTSIATGIDPGLIVAIVDTTTILGSAKGLVFTGDTLYYRGSAKPVAISYKDISKSEHKIIEKTDEKGKVTTTKIVDVFGKDGQIILNIQDPSFGHDKFSELLDAIIAEGGEEGSFQTSHQLQSLSDMDIAVRMAYIKIVTNYLHSDRETVNNKEYAEIIGIIVRNNIDNENRFILRQYIMDTASLEDNASLVKFLCANVDEGSLVELQKSLMQDVIGLFRIRETEKDDCDFSRWSNDSFLKELQKLLDVTDAQIEFFFEKFKTDEEIIKQRQTDKQIENTFKDLMAKGVAVGVPAATLFFSGSMWIIGGQLLLFGSFLPLAIAAGLGFAAFKGVKYLTGINEIEANGKRELMLQGIIRNSQKALNFLIEDVNYIAVKLSAELSKGQVTAIHIQKLKTQLLMLAQGTLTVSGRMANAEKEAVIAKLPQKLNKTRFDELTSKPTQQKYRPIVMAGFDETKTKSSDGQSRIEWILNFDLPLEKLEEIHGVLDNFGYFDVKTAGLASMNAFGKNLLGKAKGALTGE